MSTIKPGDQVCILTGWYEGNTGIVYAAVYDEDYPIKVGFSDGETNGYWEEQVTRVETSLDAEAEVERLRKLVRLVEPCISYDKSPYGNHLWREVMGVITHE